MSDQMRKQFGVTEECSARAGISVSVCTVGELRALRLLMRLSCRQFAARLGLNTCTVQGWLRRHDGTQSVFFRSAAVTTKLQSMVLYGRQIGALEYDPGYNRRGKDRSHAAALPNIPYRCAGCGQDVASWRVHKEEYQDDGRMLERLWHWKGHGATRGRCGEVQADQGRDALPVHVEAREREGHGER